MLGVFIKNSATGIQEQYVLNSKKKKNLWIEAHVCMSDCHNMVSPSHWIPTFIKQQSLWQHIILYSSLSWNLNIAICVTFYCLFIIYQEGMLMD